MLHGVKDIFIYLTQTDIRYHLQSKETESPNLLPIEGTYFSIDIGTNLTDLNKRSFKVGFAVRYRPPYRQ